MAIKLKKVAVKNPATKEVKHYARLAAQQAVTRERIIERIEKRSTMSSADVKGVLDALEFEIKEALLDGYTVRLGDLGNFRLTVSSEGSEAAEDVTAQSVKRARVQFKASPALVKAVQPKRSGGQAEMYIPSED